LTITAATPKTTLSGWMKPQSQHLKKSMSDVAAMIALLLDSCWAEFISNTESAQYRAASYLIFGPPRPTIPTMKLIRDIAVSFVGALGAIIMLLKVYLHNVK
jgi:hypothetical protein